MLKEGMRYLCYKHLYQEETLQFFKKKFQIVAKKGSFQGVFDKKNLGYLNPKQDESTYQMTLYHYKTRQSYLLYFILFKQLFEYYADRISMWNLETILPHLIFCTLDE